MLRFALLSPRKPAYSALLCRIRPSQSRPPSCLFSFHVSGLADSIKAILSNRQAGFWACADKVPQMLAVCAGATAAERADIEDAAVRLLGAAAAAPSGAQAQPLLATASKLEGPLLRTRAENAVLEALAGRVSAQLAAAQKKIAGVAPGANIAYHAAQDVQTHALPIVRAVAAFIAAAGAAGRNVLAESPAVTKGTLFSPSLSSPPLLCTLRLYTLHTCAYCVNTCEVKAHFSPALFG